MLKKYVYRGVATAIALDPPEEGGAPIDVPLIPNEIVELPDDLDYVTRLVAKGTLVPLTIESDKKTPKKEAA